MTKKAATIKATSEDPKRKEDPTPESQKHPPKPEDDEESDELVNIIIQYVPCRLRMKN